MTWHFVQKSKWTDYFDLLSRAAKGQQVKLEIIGSDIGDQIEQDWSALSGFFYDSRTGGLYFRTNYLEHFIAEPEEIVFFQESHAMAVSVKDRDGYVHVIHFLRPIHIGDMSIDSVSL